MSRSLAAYLDAAGRELRRAAVIRGMAWTILALVIGLLLASCIDFFLRSDGSMARIGLSLLAFLPGLAVGGLFVLWPLASRFGLLDVAQRIERADTSWRGALASATAFLEPRPEFGSHALQRHTLEAAEARIAAGGEPRLVNWSRVGHAIAYAAMALLVGAAILAIAPRSASVALSRLSRPFAAIEWPRRVDLAILNESGEPVSDPVNIGEGKTFRFFVINKRGALPEDLTLQTQGPSGRMRREPMPNAEEPPPGIGQGRVGVGALFAGEGPIRFRVTGGDDQGMPFRTANVVVPPRLEEIRVTVTPPAYLNAAPITTPAGVTRVRGLMGSTVTIHARANKPLASAEFLIGDQPGPRPELRNENRELLATFRLANERPSSYWFRLKDTTGFENPHAARYKITTQIDTPPEVVLGEPTADLTATPTAILSIAVQAHDDHGLTGVRLRYGPGDSLPDAQSSELEKLSQTIPLMEAANRPREHARRFDWPLERLGLEAGDQLTFRGEATDAYNLGPPRLGISSPRTVTILTPPAKREELRNRQAALLSDLAESHRATFHLLRAIDSLASDLNISKEMLATHRDQLARAELEQQRLRKHLVGQAPSSEAAAQGMLAELTANQIEDAALRTRLEHIADELAAQRENSLVSAARHLTTARKAVDAEGAAEALEAARGELAIVEEGLESLLDELGAWRNRRDVLAEISDVLGLQQSLAEETAEVAGETLGTALDQLTPEQSSRLDSLGSRQTSLAERLDRLSTQLQTPEESDEQESSPRDDAVNDKEESANEEPIRQTDPLLRAAAERLNSSGLATTARSAGHSIHGNRLGEAGRLQAEILSELEDLQNRLSRPEPTSGDSETLRRLEKELKELSDQQASVLETLRKRESNDEEPTRQERESLEAQQGELRAKAAKASRDARRAGAGQASDSLTRAVAAMTDGLERLRRRDKAEEKLAEALNKLREAEARVAEEVKKRDGGLAEPIPESTVDTIRVLAERQGALNQEVARLETLEQQRGSLSRSQLLTLRKTHGVQTTLVSETQALCAEMPEAKVIQFVLASVIQQMKHVAERLDDRDLGPETQQAGARAVARLGEIADALEPPERANRQETQPSGKPQERRSSQGRVPELAQLKLLLALQLDLRERTEALAREHGEETPKPAVMKEIEAIARELGEIRKMAASLLPGS